MKRILSILCAMMLLMTSFVIFGATAAEIPVFSASDVTFAANADVTVDVKVSGLTAEKGMDTFGVTLAYPAGYTYKSAVASQTVIDVCKFTYSGEEIVSYWIEHDAEARTVTLVAASIAPITTDGILMSVTFASPATKPADGTTFGVSALESAFVDQTGEMVEVTTADGKVISFIRGDVDGDSTLTPRDALILTRYVNNWAGYDKQIADMNAADVDGDGTPTARDALILTRYVNNWAGYEDKFAK